MICSRSARCSIDFHSAAAAVTLVIATRTFVRNIIQSPFSLDAFLRDLAASLVDMLLEAFVEVQRAPGSHSDRDKHERERNDGENGQCRPRNNVISQTVSFDGVHANKFEDEVCGGAKINKLGNQHVSISSR